MSAPVAASFRTPTLAWRSRWREDPRVRSLVDALVGARAGDTVAVDRVVGAADALLLSVVLEATSRPVVHVALGPDEADAAQQDLRAFGSDDLVVLPFPAWESAPGAGVRPTHSVFRDRLRVLEAVARGEVGSRTVVIATVGALLQPVPDSGASLGAAMRLRPGEAHDVASLCAQLTEAGLTRSPLVESPGEWSLRGGILDIFPLGADEPVRVDFFGDEIDAIRVFDPQTQRSRAELAGVHLRLRDTGVLFAGTDRFQQTLLDVVPSETVVWVREPERVQGLARELERRFGDGRSHLPAGRLLVAIERAVSVETFGLRLAAAAPGRCDLGTGSVERASGADAAAVSASILALRAERAHVTIAAATQGDARRLEQILRDHGCPPAPWGEDGVHVVEAAVSRGFDDPVRSGCLLTTHELFRRRLLRRAPRRRAARPRRAAAQPLDTFADLQPGDLVVHVVHGVGRFLGVERLDGTGGLDHLALAYQDNVKVYVPATRIDMVQRYVGVKGHKPRLAKVGGKAWRKKKEQAREAVLDLAAELLSIQAVRSLETGTSFVGDDHLQAAFEAAFPFEETEDQLVAAEAIRDDMALGRPMDRLLCGDVGYGKTELAMRAAFRATRSGRQAAVLVPTTILAEQHHQTFRERLAEFPARVACLSRFRRGREVREILRRIQEGEVDILIGTHRLLSRDVHFRNLGLIVVDEEQRFGVTHKARLKHLRRTVDVLTMTATPIPRTLHMALLGLRDISALAEAPSGRRAIRTVVTREDPAQVREAILRELAREGQVFYVHNRVKTIEWRARELEALVPEARFAVGHGQLPEATLEARMLAFLQGDVDVLVATTIVESGLDIPRANTIIIDRADRFGLAELHQLRGRVGRGAHRAYAYLLVPRRGRLTEVAKRRLQAIEEYSGLGAGFRIAMRDLEIRGAGSLLGAKQSGHIAQVGYDLYCRLLQDACAELRRRGRIDRTALARAIDPPQGGAPAGDREGPAAGAEPEPEPELRLPSLERGVDIALRVEARLPERYIEDTRQRLSMYRRLAHARTLGQVEAARAELRDRFGPPPPSTELLCRWTELRVLCGQLGVIHVSADGKMAVLRTRGRTHRLRQRLHDRGAKALWPERTVCFCQISRRADPPPAEVLEALVDALTPQDAHSPPDPATKPKTSPGRRVSGPQRKDNG